MAADIGWRRLYLPECFNCHTDRPCRSRSSADVPRGVPALAALRVSWDMSIYLYIDVKHAARPPEVRDLALSGSAKVIEGGTMPVPGRPAAVPVQLRAAGPR